jgi:para-aminobenzoate synthetase component 1
LTRLAELDYLPDSAVRFEQLRDLPWPVFLESGAHGTSGDRYDVLAADPSARVITRGEQTEVVAREGTRITGKDPLDVIRGLLGGTGRAVSGLPFAGGAIGYFAYDLGRRYESLQTVAEADIGMPDLAVGIYDWAVIVDHLERKTWLVAQERNARTAERWNEIVRRFGVGALRPEGHFEVVSPIGSNLSKSDYGEAFARIQEHIRCGDTYQVNLTQRFEAAVRGDSWHAYKKLRRVSPAPFSAYLDYPFGQVLCSSPERFLRVRDGHVQTKPIKGTRPRSADAEHDAAMLRELEQSSKDRAENVMIVDLLRNDLGKNCMPGSIRVAKLYDIESFANVHHLVSTIEGRLAPGRDAIDVLRGSFPGGSITGAPKVRAMQIIENLEPHRRSVYCGAIGYIGFDGAMDTNIAIRTLVHCGNTIYAWSGGGIVADSSVEGEYQESLDKASALLAVLAESRVSVAS